LKIDAMQYFLVLNFFTSINFIFMGYFLVEDTFYFNFDETKGIFGWIYHNNFVYSVIVVSFVNGVGTLGL